MDADQTAPSVQILYKLHWSRFNHMLKKWTYILLRTDYKDCIMVPVLEMLPCCYPKSGIFENVS